MSVAADSSDLSEVPDEELLSRARATDTQAVAALFERYGDRAYRVARSVGDDFDAQTAVVKAFSALTRPHVSDPPRRSSLVAWLLSDVLDCATERATLRDRGPTADAGRAPAKHALTDLPDVQRDVIVLAHYGELTCGEIAEHLAVPIGTVKALMRFALLTLARQSR